MAVDGAKLRRQARKADQVELGLDCGDDDDINMKKRSSRRNCFPHPNIYRRPGLHSAAFCLLFVTVALYVSRMGADLSPQHPKPLQQRLLGNLPSQLEKPPKQQLEELAKQLEQQNPKEPEQKIVFAVAYGVVGIYGIDPLTRSKEDREPDYVGLEISKSQWGVEIAVDASDQYEVYRSEYLEAMDNAETIRTRGYNDEDLEDEKRQCRRVSWNHDNFPDCNTVHELSLERVFGSRRSLQDYNVTYIGTGTYREAWRFNSPGESEFAMKRLRMSSSLPFNFVDQNMVKKEAIIMERLTHTPRVIDIYGYCATTVLLEAMKGDIHTKMVPGDGYISQEELDKLQKDDVYPLNDYTPAKKFQMALDMAESLADIHGFEGGPITHADVDVDQWLLAQDGSLKLNDFNNAFFPEWDDEKGEYCTRSAAYGGMFSSPEEFDGGTLDERVDVYSYGNIIYASLTGLWPFYEEKRYKPVQEKVMAGERAYIDPRYRTRSYLEGKLVEIMELCWEHERTKRMEIFEVVKFLREVKANATEMGLLGN